MIFLIGSDGQKTRKITQPMKMFFNAGSDIVMTFSGNTVEVYSLKEMLTKLSTLNQSTFSTPVAFRNGNLIILTGDRHVKISTPKGSLIAQVKLPSPAGVVYELGDVR